MTQQNLGNALRTLGERESGTARLEEAVAAYRAALEERTRARVPLEWARTQTTSVTRSRRSARARAGRRGWRRRSRPIGRRWRNGPRSASHDGMNSHNVVSQRRLRSYNDAKSRLALSGLSI